MKTGSTKFTKRLLFCFLTPIFFLLNKIGTPFTIPHTWSIHFTNTLPALSTDTNTPTPTHIPNTHSTQNTSSTLHSTQHSLQQHLLHTLSLFVSHSLFSPCIFIQAHYTNINMDFSTATASMATTSSQGPMPRWQRKVSWSTPSPRT